MSEHLSEKQLARAQALKVAREISRTGAFGSVTLPDVPELIDVAEYILRGVHPYDRVEVVTQIAEEASEAAIVEEADTQ